MLHVLLYRNLNVLSAFLEMVSDPNQPCISLRGTFALSRAIVFMKMYQKNRCGSYLCIFIVDAVIYPIRTLLIPQLFTFPENEICLFQLLTNMYLGLILFLNIHKWRVIADFSMDFTNPSYFTKQSILNLRRVLFVQYQLFLYDTH